MQIAAGLTRRLIDDLLAFNEEDLAYFLTPKSLNQLSAIADSLQRIQTIPFQQALCRIGTTG